MSDQHKSPAFQFYPKDFLSDTEAMSMTNEEVGMYFKLLCFDWINDGFPDSDSTILKITNFDFLDEHGDLRESSKNQHALQVLRDKMVPHPSKIGYLTNNRLIEERKKQKKFKKKAIESGKKGAKARWQKKTLKSDLNNIAANKAM